MTDVSYTRTLSLAGQHARPEPLNLKLTQADHHDHMAKVSDAYASAYEGDIQYARGSSKQKYLRRRAREHRREAEFRRTKANELRLAVASD